MSDIAIRFDGVLLAAFLALASSIFFLMAFVPAVAWLTASDIRYRWRIVGRTSAFFGFAYLLCLLVLVLHLTNSPSPVTGPDWLDWLSLPSLVVFVIGCVLIMRRSRAAR